MVVLDGRVHRLWRYTLLTADYGVQPPLLLLWVCDPDERHGEGVEAVLAVTRVAGAGFGDSAGADDLGVGVAQPTQAHALDEDVPDLTPFVRQAKAQPFHRALEAVQVVLEAEEAAAPDVGHVIGRVRAQEPPVEDRDSRLSNGYEPPVHKGRAISVRLTSLRRPHVLLHLHLRLTLFASGHLARTDRGCPATQGERTIPNSQFKIQCERFYLRCLGLNGKLRRCKESPFFACDELQTSWRPAKLGERGLCTKRSTSRSTTRTTRIRRASSGSTWRGGSGARSPVVMPTRRRCTTSAFVRWRAGSPRSSVMRTR